MPKLPQESIPHSESRDRSIEQGTFVPSATLQPPTTIVIATFNIRYAVGSHLISGSLLRRLGISRPGRRTALVSRNTRQAARFLSSGTHMPPVQILALQEADKKTVRAGGIHVARELARELQMHYAHASMNIPRGSKQKANRWYLDFEEHIANDDPGDTGLATLSTLPVTETIRVDLPWSDCAWRPRLAIESIIPIGNLNLHVFNSHIDPHADTDEQLEQHKAVIAKANQTNAPTILLGDFNTLTSESRLKMRALLKTHGYTTPFPNGVSTWRSGPIRLQPDWIFVHDVRVTRSGVARRLTVSDHWPVWIEIEINDPAN